MAATSSLELLHVEITAELAAQERHATAIDAKAGVLLGFAGVLVGLSVGNLDGLLANVAAGAAGFAAFFAGWATLPRSFPTLNARKLRDKYLGAEEGFTRLRLLDTRIAIYSQTRAILKVKARLVTAATFFLGSAVILTVVAGILDNRGR